MPVQSKKLINFTIWLLLIIASNIALSNETLAFNITLESIDFSDPLLVLDLVLRLHQGN